MTTNIPERQRALVISDNYETRVQDIPVPQAGPGSAIVRVIAGKVISYMPDIYDGTRSYPFPKPMVAGSSVIARVVSVGPDATLLSPGQLVFVDATIRGRDDPSSAALIGIHEGSTEGSKKLLYGEWRNSTFAEYAKVPLEICILLDEKILLGSKKDGGLCYSPQDLTGLSTMLVPFGGLRDIGLKAGETIIIAPATGGFGASAVHVALAMGARVIAMGRNVEALNRLAARSNRVHTVRITGDLEADTKALSSFGRVDAYLDISPPQALETTHIKSAIMALGHGARISLMGGLSGDVAIPHAIVMHKEMQLRGKFMYDRGAIEDLLKMIQVGILPLGDAAGIKSLAFSLEDWKAAFKSAKENPGLEVQAVITP